MIRSILFALILLGSSMALTSCGIVSHQMHRAANLLRVPVRMTQAPLHDAIVAHIAGQA